MAGNGMVKIGFLGLGKYSSELFKALLKNNERKEVFQYKFYIYDKDENQVSKYNGEEVTVIKKDIVEEGMSELVKKSDIIFVGLPLSKIEFTDSIRILEEVLEKESNKSKTLIFMDNLDYYIGLYERAKSIYQIMFNMSVAVNDKKDNIIVLYPIKDKEECVKKILENLGKVIVVNDYIDLIKYRIVLGAGLAVVSKLKNENEDVQYWKEAIRDFLNIGEREANSLVKSLENGIERLKKKNLGYVNRYEKCNYNDVYNLIYKNSFATKMLVKRFDIEEIKKHNNAKEILDSVLDSLCRISLERSLGTLAVEFEKLQYARDEQKLNLGVVMRMFKYFLRDYKRFFTFFNLIDIENKKIYFGIDGKSNKIISFWSKSQKQYNNYITSLTSILKRIEGVFYLWMVVNDEEFTKKEDEIHALKANIIVEEITNLMNDECFREKIRNHRDKLNNIKEESKFFGELIHFFEVLFRKNEVLFKSWSKKVIIRNYRIQRILDKNLRKKILNYHVWLALAYGYNGFKYFFYIPSSKGGNVKYVLAVGLRKWLGETIIIKLQNLLKSVVIPILDKEIQQHALKSAIAAIMARNMSHNIGSHVLADLANFDEV